MVTPDTLASILEDLLESDKKSFPSADEIITNQLLKNREIWIEDNIYEGSTNVITRAIQYWNREDFGKPVNERKPIILHICSCGGDCDISNCLISTIEASTTPVWGICEGRAYSAGAYIFLMCHKKLMGKYATLLLHECSIEEIGGHADDIDIHTKEQKWQNNQINQIILNNSTFTEKEVKKLIKHDWIIHADEALERKMIDSIFSNVDEFIIQ